MAASSNRTLFLIRKIHIHSGLFLLWLTWLFALSGVMLNHPKWEISKFWERRDVQTEVTPLEIPPIDAEKRVETVLKQLEIDGEPESIHWSDDSGAFTVSVVRPGTIVEVSVNAELTQAEVKRTQTDGAGIVHMLHTFNGVSVDEPARQRDWFWSTAWVAVMDMLAIALGVWVISGYYLWLKLGKMTPFGATVAGLGILLAGFFLFVTPYLP
ncbi:MAG: hypothetical protein JSU96_10635 [Acidobacteriota bacterium]|nr:MAG: hypothetical protein JSU96_10635 [Acidobacteriota bacterium]